ncbi:Rho termination factor N-terminal domain-containing protein [Pseudomonas sp. NPDC007930]|uniref:Rho termination factor N-terminal domain-containing protein n=1 Tax=Pseudomonas sp. NPDC007930 TaxID=3364417 RepID=UPI0036F0E129
MSSTAKKTKPKLWDRIKQRVTDSDKGGRPGQWSARKAQLATQDYQREGGGYEGPKRADNGLREWAEQERLSKLSKPALLEKASALRIRGRSRMNKVELIEALEKNTATVR